MLLLGLQVQVFQVFWSHVTILCRTDRNLSHLLSWFDVNNGLTFATWLSVLNWAQTFNEIWELFFSLFPYVAKSVTSDLSQVYLSGFKVLKCSKNLYPWTQPSFSTISEDSIENPHASFISGLFASSMLKHKHCWFKRYGGKYCITMCIFQQNGPNCTLHNCFCQSERIYRLLGARCAVTVKYLCAHWKNVLWRLSWAAVCWGRSPLTCYNVLFLRDWGNVMLFALPFAKRPAGFNHSTEDELDRRRGDPSSGQISCENYFSATSNTHSTRSL